MKVRGIELRKGDRAKGFYPWNPGYWEIESLRPFRVYGVQDGKRFQLRVSPIEFAGEKKMETKEANDWGEKTNEEQG